ncbi:MAG: microcystin-dependent protein [Lentisphaeria bacterium]|jgi:microcystin-dependent protein
MAEPFLSEIRMFGFAWTPRGWAACNGQVIPISDNQALYALLGTTYGGDGRTNFSLPDMRSRTPVSMGDNQGEHFNQGDHGGIENVTLSLDDMGQHTHEVRGSTSQADGKQFTNAFFADGYDVTTSQPTDMYGPAANLQNLHPNSVSASGGGGQHYNIQPSLAVNFCIAITGQFPSRN